MCKFIMEYQLTAKKIIEKYIDFLQNINMLLVL